MQEWDREMQVQQLDQIYWFWPCIRSDFNKSKPAVCIDQQLLPRLFHQYLSRRKFFVSKYLALLSRHSEKGSPMPILPIPAMPPSGNARGNGKEEIHLSRNIINAFDSIGINIAVCRRGPMAEEIHTRAWVAIVISCGEKRNKSQI